MCANARKRTNAMFSFNFFCRSFGIVSHTYLGDRFVILRSHAIFFCFGYFLLRWKRIFSLLYEIYMTLQWPTHQQINNTRGPTNVIDAILSSLTPACQYTHAYTRARANSHTHTHTSMNYCFHRTQLGKKIINFWRIFIALTEQ